MRQRIRAEMWASATLWLIATALLTTASAQVARKSKSEPLTIQEQGSFAVGGKVTTNPGTFNPKQPTPQGQTLHGDHAYVFYQIPVSPRKLPLVFLHGTGQFSKTWETTPDGREGFQTIFLRRRFPVYLFDQPRRGNAGRSTCQPPSTPCRMSKHGSIPSGLVSGRNIFQASSSRKILRLSTSTSAK